MSIEFKLKKYETIQPSEAPTLKRNCVHDWRTSQKIRLAQIRMDHLSIQGGNRERVLYIIKNYSLRELHGNASKEVIIDALCFYVLKSFNSSAKIEDYSILNEDGLNYQIYGTVVTNMLKLKIHI